MDNVFIRTKAVIARHGWCKDGARTPDGRICLATALELAGVREALDGLAGTRYPAVRSLFTAIRTYQPDGLRFSAHGPGSLQPVTIPVWNDHPDTTLDDVNAVLDIAAKQWEADHPSD